jgi:hypothetical protein
MVVSAIISLCLYTNREANIHSLHTAYRNVYTVYIHCKKRFAVFPSAGGTSLAKLSLARNILIIPGQGKFG